MKSYDSKRYDQAAELLPFSLRLAAEALPVSQKDQAEEFRLRVGHVPTVLLPQGEQTLPDLKPLSQADLSAVLEIATRASVHAAMDSIQEGYISTRGGFRVGICGSAATQKGEITGFRSLSSLSIRISREILGLASRVLGGLTEAGEVQSTLILSPPGGGKTTLLRDLIRAISEGEDCLPRRVSLADERGEVAALAGGQARLNVGRQTDVLDGAPKAKAAMLLLRAMNPQVLAMDEVSAPEDIEALRLAANCGVTLLASAHAQGPEDLQRRPLYRQLEGIFSRLVCIHWTEGERHYEVLPC